MDRTEPRPSMADVARLAGVSPQTVSRVVNGVPRVHPRTRAQVQQAMAQLNYVPNGPARALRGGTSRTIGVVVHRLSGTAESSMVEAIAHAAREAGYTLALAELQTPTCAQLQEAVSRLQQHLIDGLIVIRHELTELVAPELEVTVPHVVSDPASSPGRPWVGVDQAQGTEAAVQHLLSLGHRTVHHLAGPTSSGPALARERSWHRALAAAGREVPAVVRGDWSPESGTTAGRRLLQRRRRGESVTAVLAANDEMAAGLLSALGSARVSVPHEVSVVGFDNIPLARYLSPPLTTVEQDFARVGRELVTSLLAQLRSSGRPRPGERLVVPAPLIVRGSTAPPGEPSPRRASPAACARTARH